MGEFGFGLHLVFEAEVSKAGEVVSLGRAGAGAAGGRGLLQLILPGLYEALEKRLGFFRLPQFLESEALEVGLRGGTAVRGRRGRGYGPLPGLGRFPGIAGAFIGDAGPVSELGSMNIGRSEEHTSELQSLRHLV